MRSDYLAQSAKAWLASLRNRFAPGNGAVKSA